MRKKPFVAYLVSGDATIAPTDKILRRSHRHVRYGSQVDKNAAKAIRAGRRYVVVAHGNPDGSVMWFRSDVPPAARWLWDKMPTPPKNARIYLYCCHSGKKLPKFLKTCDCFGHASRVPMVEDIPHDVVLAYLNEVNRLMESATYDAEAWRVRLGRYVNAALVQEQGKPRTILGFQKLLLLRDSLGNVDE